jgi:hypothetical protein
MDITDIPIEQDQQLGSLIPRFRTHTATGLSDIFDGPLFRVVEVTGADSSGEPLPRLLIHFLWAFNKARYILQGENGILWAQNRILVVTIAGRYIEDSRKNQHYCLHRYIPQVNRIIHNCYCCTNLGPCLICEFNTQSIAFLFRTERARIRAIQQVTQVVRQKVRCELEPAIIACIVGYIEGGAESIERIRGLTLHTILFIQDSWFAPEIRSIITRRQLITWALAVENRRIRPFQQAVRLEGNQPDSSVPWPFGAYLLRAHPVYSLDQDWTGPLIALNNRTPPFLSIGDYNLSPSSSVILANRERNLDFWVEDTPSSAGSPFLGFEDHSFRFSWDQPDAFGWDESDGSEDSFTL